MIKELSQSSGSVVGYKVSGTITKEDYETFVPQVQALVEQEGSINMLLDLEGFEWEKVSAWGADMNFGHEYHEKITKMAIVGDKKWEKWLTKLVDPFYASQAKYFHTTEMDAAWDWLREA